MFLDVVLERENRDVRCCTRNVVTNMGILQALSESIKVIVKVDEVRIQKVCHLKIQNLFYVAKCMY